jgi:hypothetical protein
MTVIDDKAHSCALEVGPAVELINSIRSGSIQTAQGD